MKKEQLDKNVQKIKQKLKILLSNDQFQDDILKLRCKYSINSDGLKSNEESEKWQRWLYRESDSFAKNNRYPLQTEFNTLREYMIARQKFNDSTPINAFNLDLENLISKYRLSPKLKNSLKHYLLFNNEEQIPPYSNVSIHLNYDRTGKPKDLSLIIDQDTTLEDIKAIWPDVKIWQEGLPYKTQRKFQPKPNLDEDLLILNLREKGKTFKEIEKYLSDKYHLEIPYDYVSKRYYRLRKKIANN